MMIKMEQPKLDLKGAAANSDIIVGRCPRKRREEEEDDDDDDDEDEEEGHYEGKGGLLPDELIVLEVVSRLKTADQIHRCRRVSKLWRSMISTPLFYNIHHDHNHQGLGLGGVILCCKKSTRPEDLRFLYSPLIRCSMMNSNNHRHRVSEKLLVKPFVCPSRLELPSSAPDTIRFTNVLNNGLSCVYDANSITLVNVFTAETMRLPANEFDRRESMCFLGYDPLGKVYKVLKLFETQLVCTELAQDGHGHKHKRRFDSLLTCEVLTIGHDSSWRKLDHSVPVAEFDLSLTICGTSFLSVNGVIYWKMFSFGEVPHIIAFYLNREKLQKIKPPERDLYARDTKQLFCTPQEFRGRPALYVPYDVIRPTVSAFLVLEDAEGDCWSKHTITFPNPLKQLKPLSQPRDWDFFPIGNLPTGQILLELSFYFKHGSMTPSEGFTNIYSYDHLTCKFERLLVGGRLSNDPISGKDGFPFSDEEGFTISAITFLVEKNIAAPFEVLFEGV